jgi:hypothetical protein
MSFTVTSPCCFGRVTHPRHKLHGLLPAYYCSSSLNVTTEGCVQRPGVVHNKWGTLEYACYQAAINEYDLTLVKA